MWMHYSVVDIAYQDKATGELFSLNWERNASAPTVNSRNMRWQEIFPGVSLEIILSEDRIKENIYLSQQARDNLPAPSQFGIPAEQTSIVIVYAFMIYDDDKDYTLKDRLGERQ